MSILSLFTVNKYFFGQTSQIFSQTSNCCVRFEKKKLPLITRNHLLSSQKFLFLRHNLILLFFFYYLQSVIQESMIVLQLAFRFLELKCFGFKYNWKIFMISWIFFYTSPKHNKNFILYSLRKNKLMASFHFFFIQVI